GHRQQAVLAGVAVEDLAEARRDHAADAEAHQRPDRALARAAAAEVRAGDEDACGAVARLVEHEIGNLLALRVVAPVGKQLGTEVDRRRQHVDRRNDRAGIDVGANERRRDVAQDGKLFHGGPQIRRRTSTMQPLTAAAATMAGLARWVRLLAPWRSS